MWNALRVLLHRPLVADGHLHLTLPSTSKLSFAACTEAAMNIVKLVRLYDKAFSMGRAPYLMSYATYVAATIHVRIAATRPSSSEAHDHLRTCLRVFDRNSETNYAVRKAAVVIEALMDRMGVSIDHADAGNDTGNRTNTPNTTNSTGPRGDIAAPRQSSDYSHLQMETRDNPEPTMVAGQFVPGLDVDAIIHSFMQEQQSGQTDGGYVPMNTATNFPNAQGDENLNSMQSFSNAGMFDDALFGFNASGYDWYYPNVSHP
jgi:hypothetical protein